MEKKDRQHGDNAMARTPRLQIKIPNEYKHLQKSGIPQSARESYAKWRKERIEHLKRIEQWGNELASLMAEEASLKK
ncbi:MAG: hypothetical protein JNN28_12275 [Saprospiraceae bacterium]|nr:hypothetical protein [Saprospiraceae bacterium]